MLLNGEGNDKYRKGGFYRIDDRDGSRQRNYNTVKEWNGAIVSRQDWEPRHPQDFVKGIPDRQDVPDPRPVEAVANASYVGASTTASINANAPAGAKALVFDSTAGFSVGDQVAIYMDNSERFLSTIATLSADGVSLTISTPLIFSVSPGDVVIDLTAIVPVGNNYPSTISG